MNPRILAVLAVVALAAACSEQSAPTKAASEGAASSDATAPVAAACPEAPAGYQPFPAGVTTTLDYHLRSDRIYTHAASGKLRRRVALEFLEGDAAAAQAALTESLKDAGFRAKPGKQRPGGATTLAFAKSGLGILKMVVRPAAPARPAHPDARGEISLDYPATDVVAVETGSPAA